MPAGPHVAGTTSRRFDDDGGRAFAFPDWNADAAYFRDPDRNVVELIAHHDLPEPHRPPFGPGSMLGVCEVGVPVDDVGEFLESLERRTGARRRSATIGPSPATDATIVAARASLSSSDGRRPPIVRARSVLPVPGGPTRRSP